MLLNAWYIIFHSNFFKFVGGLSYCKRKLLHFFHVWQAVQLAEYNHLLSYLNIRILTTGINDKLDFMALKKPQKMC